MGLERQGNNWRCQTGGAARLCEEVWLGLHVGVKDDDQLRPGNGRGVGARALRSTQGNWESERPSWCLAHTHLRLRAAGRPARRDRQPQKGHGGHLTGKITLRRQLLRLALLPLISPGVRARPDTYLRGQGAGHWQVCKGRTGPRQSAHISTCAVRQGSPDRGSPAAGIGIDVPGAAAHAYMHVYTCMHVTICTWRPAPGSQYMPSSLRPGRRHTGRRCG